MLETARDAGVDGGEQSGRGMQMSRSEVVVWSSGIYRPRLRVGPGKGIGEWGGGVCESGYMGYALMGAEQG